MYPGPDLVFACPHCAALVRQGTWASTNTFGATLWSDGCTAGPMLGHQSPWVRCPACAGCFWLADAKELGSFDRYDDEGTSQVNPAWVEAPLVEKPTESEYHAGCAQSPAASAGREKALRVLAWHAGNDPHRNGEAPHGQRAWQPQFIANLEALVGLLDEASPDETIMKAEALRELGRFDEALFQLRRVHDEGAAHAVAAIAGLCHAKQRDVAPLSDPE